MQAAIVGLQSEKGSARRADDPLDEWDMALRQCRRAKGWSQRSAEGSRGNGRSTEGRRRIGWSDGGRRGMG